MTDQSYMDARRIVDTEECKTSGHRWQFIEEFGSEIPVAIVCDRNCGTPSLTVHLPLHNAAGACEPDYHRSLPGGGRCRCGKVVCSK